MVVHRGVGHYGAPITLDQAKKVMAAAEAKAKQNSWSVAISIVDSGGHAVMLHRLDGTQLASIRIAEAKLAPRSSFVGRPRRLKMSLRLVVRGCGISPCRTST
jgi:hypothetical protein